MAQKFKKQITVATFQKLRSIPYRNRLKIAVISTGTGQRDWPTKIQNMFLYADRNGIKFFYPDGRIFPVPLVDDVWRNERYIREFLASETCKYPDRDRLISLFFRVMLPEIFKHFSK